MDTVNHAFVGLPKSGKTTFLAALWHLIESREIETKLILDKLEGDQSHLTALAESWRGAVQVPRTSLAKEATVRIHIKEVATSKKSVLTFPDLDGEAFESQIEQRYCKKDYFETIEGNGGIFLFVTANTPYELSVLELNELAGPDDEQETVEVNSAASYGEFVHEGEVQSVVKKNVDWTHKLMPYQVKVVELLQFLHQSPFKPAKRKMAIMISAWDVLNPKPKPEEWLATKMPMLDQFLKTNASLFDVKIYGISALGGDITDMDTKKKLLTMSTPSERLSCVEALGESSDITNPILWMMSES